MYWNLPGHRGSSRNAWKQRRTALRSMVLGLLACWKPCSYGSTRMDLRSSRASATSLLRLHWMPRWGNSTVMSAATRAVHTPFLQPPSPVLARLINVCGCALGGSQSWVTQLTTTMAGPEQPTSCKTCVGISLQLLNYLDLWKRLFGTVRCLAIEHPRPPALRIITKPVLVGGGLFKDDDGRFAVRCCVCLLL